MELNWSSGGVQTKKFCEGGGGQIFYGTTHSSSIVRRNYSCIWVQYRGRSQTVALRQSYERLMEAMPIKLG